jgi:hypothetical protein
MTLVLGAGLAQAGYITTFDSFSAGQQLSATDGWQGWDNVASVAGTIVTLNSYSGTNAMSIGSGYTDAVRTFSNADSGVWSFSARQFLASGQSGSTYVILMNTYQNNGAHASGMWSGQLNFDLGSGVVRDDYRGGSVAIAFDQWALITMSIDLTNNTLSQYYNGTLIASGAWKTAADSALNIAALDLFTEGGNTALYDDISLTGPTDIPSPGALAAFASVAVVLSTRRSRSR